MTAVLTRLRQDAPHGPFPLSVGPTTLNFSPDLTGQATSQFAGAQADLERQRGVVEPLRLDSVGNTPVRTPQSMARFDVTQTLLVRFSAVGFNRDSTRAMVVFSLDCGAYCGSVALAALQRRSRLEWVVEYYREISRQ